MKQKDCALITHKMLNVTQKWSSDENEYEINYYLEKFFNSVITTVGIKH